jgi:ADP-heptose:LPS heptosyltransferase
MPPDSPVARARSTEITRLLDRRFGGIAALTAGVLTRRRQLPAAPRSIGILQPTAIGDTFMGSSVLAAIHARYPAARLLVFHGPSNRDAVRMLMVPAEPVCCHFTSMAQTMRVLRSANLDLIVDQVPWANLTALYARLSAPVTVGFAPAGAPRARLFDIPVPHLTTRHESQNHAAMAALIGHAGPYRMAVATSPCAIVAELPLDRLVLFHMTAGGSRASEKAWPAAHWAMLARRLTEAGYVVGFTGLEQDNLAAEAIARQAKIAYISLCGKLPLDQLGDLLTRVRLLITVDTSVAHLATAVDAPVLALYGPTRSWRWGPVTGRGRAIDSPHPGAGYVKYGYEQSPHGSQVMSALTVEAVVEAAHMMLEGEVNDATSYGKHMYAGDEHQFPLDGVTPGPHDARPFGE